MGKDVLFKWEDCPALKHHCGFCERPLSHPSAKSSCFGTHSEPCHRFHQIMFMRGRAHTCAACASADEAHHKRHFDIAERLRTIYQICGEDWPIVPSDGSERGRSKRREPDSPNDQTPPPSDTPASKRERKEQKRLYRGSSRPRITTQEDIRYIESVLHVVDTSGDGKGPSSAEEVEEIEKNLQYHAKVYNTGAKRRILKELAHVPDSELDFEGEMDRILEVLRVTELQKRNNKQHGLQGKELRHFGSLVDEFRSRVVDDLLLLKKEDMEIRMRRAAYLRYVNRESFDIVEERYTIKDRKTGQKLPSTSRGSSSSRNTTMTTEDEEGDTSYEVEWTDNSSPFSTNAREADVRHLSQSHRRVGSDGKLGKVVSIRRSPIRASTMPQGIPKKQPPQLKLVVNKSYMRENSAHTPMQLHSTLSVKSSGRRKVSPRRISPGPKRQLTVDENGWKLVDISSPISEEFDTTIPELRSSSPSSVFRESFWRANARIHQAEMVTHANDEPERAGSVPSPEQSFLKSNYVSPEGKFIVPQGSRAKEKDLTARTLAPGSPECTTLTPQPYRSDQPGHPPVEQKKRKKEKKKQREMERKARRAAEQEIQNDKEAQDAESSIDGGAFEGGPPVYSNCPASDGEGNNEDASGPNIHIEDIAPMLAKPISRSSLSTTALTANEPSKSSPALPFPIAKIERHSDWGNYVSFLRVDSLSSPQKTSKSYLGPGDTCIFETTNTPDCPFHNPYLPRNDPFVDQYFLVYPKLRDHSIGPCNRLRGQKLLACYESHPKTKGQLMLIDAEIMNWQKKFYDETSQKKPVNAVIMPERLVMEVTRYQAGYEKGPLMRDTERFLQIVRWGRQSTTNVLSKEQLEEIQKGFENACHCHSVCYCHSKAPAHCNAEEFVQCAYHKCPIRYFHRRCVKNLGVEKVTTWYCTNCEANIAVDAWRVLKEVAPISQEELEQVLDVATIKMEEASTQECSTAYPPPA